MENITRRNVIKTAAWSVPVVLAAVSVPLASASEVPVQKIPVSCEYLQNHGHGGDTSNSWWFVTYDDGSSETLDNGTVQSDPTLRKMCVKTHS